MIKAENFKFKYQIRNELKQLLRVEKKSIINFRAHDSKLCQMEQKCAYSFERKTNML